MTDEDRTLGPDAEPPGETARGSSEVNLEETISSIDFEGRTIGIADEPRPIGAPVPETIGDYRIIGVLGEGRMGIVYEAEQSSPRRRFALKVIRGGRFVDEEDTTRREPFEDALATYRSALED